MTGKSNTVNSLNLSELKNVVVMQDSLLVVARVALFVFEQNRPRYERLSKALAVLLHQNREFNTKQRSPRTKIALLLCVISRWQIVHSYFVPVGKLYRKRASSCYNYGQ